MAADISPVVVVGDSDEEEASRTTNSKNELAMNASKESAAAIGVKKNSSLQRDSDSHMELSTASDSQVKVWSKSSVSSKRSAVWAYFSPNPDPTRKE